MDVSSAYNDYDTPVEKAIRASLQRKEMLNQTNVLSGRIVYKQELTPDNPIEYL